MKHLVLGVILLGLHFILGVEGLECYNCSGAACSNPSAGVVEQCGDGSSCYTARAMNIAYAQRGCSSDCQTFADDEMSWVCCATNLCNTASPWGPTTHLALLVLLAVIYLMT